MLKIDNISKTFSIGTVNEKLALSDINLDVNTGDFITIIGSNGAGKSTLFNSISGDFKLDKGSIILDDIDITKRCDYQRSKYIGRLFQDPLRGSAPHMTIKENLALAYMRADKNKKIFSCISKKDEEFFKEELKKLDLNLEDRMDTKVGLLSGGQRQALTLLMATIVPPKVLLLDEHTAALDPIMAEKIMDLTERIVKENRITCLMITHNLKMALATGNRTLIMNKGRIIKELDETTKKNMDLNELLSVFKESLNDDRLILEEWFAKITASNVKINLFNKRYNSIRQGF